MFLDKMHIAVIIFINIMLIIVYFMGEQICAMSYYSRKLLCRDGDTTNGKTL